MKAYNIQWDTDGADIESPELPSSVIIPEHIAATRDDEIISDWLSDEYGFCHFGFALDEEVDNHEV